MLRAESEGDRKNLADRLVVGRLVERAFELMGISKQDAAYRLHYADAGTISRWCSGTERPLFDKLFTLRGVEGRDGFTVAYVRALAEFEPAIEVTTTITIRQVA